MSFSNRRQYLRDRIAIVDPDLEEIDDAFGDQDLDSARNEDAYKIVFGTALQTNTAGNAYGLEVPVTISIFDSRGRSEVDRFDLLYDKASSIRDEILRPCEVKNQNDFSDILGDTITPSKELTDDKTFRMDLSFTIRIDNYYS